MSKKYEHRKSQVTLNLIHSDGTPVKNREVKIEQTRHEFLFGCGGFDSVELASGIMDGVPISAGRKEFLEDRMDKILKLNNYLTLPFYLGRYEAEEGKPDESRVMAAAKWLKERDVFLKGHPLCWHTVWPTWLMKYSNNEILKKALERIERDVLAFKGIIDSWDVINEVVIMPIFDKYDNAITRICKEMGRVGLIREVFEAAVAANPHGTFLLNDFDLSTKYEILIDGCLQADIPIDVIGLQTHQHQGYKGVEWFHQILERFEHFGLPLHFTENTLISGEIMPAHIDDLNDWQVDEWPSTPAGEERQAREAVELYELLFSHPSVEAITTWDPADGKWLKAPSGLLREDNSIKPVYEALMEKIKGEWWTKESLATNEAGAVTLSGFRGDYIVSCGGEKIKQRFALDGKNEMLTVVFD
ncbi:MAG: endo-1,4-beta-xylanase [Lachnospiraceae bacterium]|nr:endo-1,4-beta-xylanase [Lachnospiraceae bacterium]